MRRAALAASGKAIQRAPMKNDLENNSASSRDQDRQEDSEKLEGAKPSSDHRRNPTDYANGREKSANADRERR